MKRSEYKKMKEITTGIVGTVHEKYLKTENYKAAI